MTNSTFGGLDFEVGNRWVILGDLLTIFAYKIFNIGVESIKIVTNMQTMNNHKKILVMKLFENVGKDRANFDKNCNFLQKCDLFQIKFCVIT